MKQSKYIQTVLLYYYRYKAFIAPVSIVVVCSIVILFVLVPESLRALSLHAQIGQESSNLQTLQQNFQKVTTLNDDQLENQYNISVSALPAEKDVIGILNAISTTASKSNVSLQDYNFQAGDIKDNAKLTKIQIVLNINGDIASVQSFIHELKRTLPISDVTEVNAGSTNTAAVTVDFYVKSFSKESFDANVPLQLLSQKNQETLGTLESWKNNQ